MFSLNGSHCSSSFSFFFSRVPITPASAFYFTSISNQRDFSFFFLLLFCKMRESFLCVNLNPWIVPRHFFFFFESERIFIIINFAANVTAVVVVGKTKEYPLHSHNTHILRANVKLKVNLKWLGWSWQLEGLSEDWWLGISGPNSTNRLGAVTMPDFAC